MSTVLPTSAVGPLRLLAQRLAGPRAPGPAEAVRHLGAVQAQDLPGALVSVALRTGARDVAEVAASLADGHLLRSWPMRGTLHLVPARDLGWMLALTAPRMTAAAARRRAELGLDEAVLGRALDVATGALSGGRALSREDLLAAWAAAGLDVAGGRGYHLLFHLSATGVLCLGPLVGRDQLVVLLPERVPDPHRPEREEALATWALRFFRSHGPATAKDFTRWTGLTAADVRTALAGARPELAAVEVDGVEHLLDPALPDLLPAHREEAAGVFLLPGFDEFVLGYGERGAVLAPEFAARIVPGGNGVFRPTVVAGGRVVGTWRHAGRGARRSLDAEAFTGFGAAVEAALPAVYAALPAAP
ncbi:crosslink repair DNA glycosylase YcaQ family protein [Kineococcus sp. NUM-3379]